VTIFAAHAVNPGQADGNQQVRQDHEVEHACRFCFWPHDMCHGQIIVMQQHAMDDRAEDHGQDKECDDRNDELLVHGFSSGG
jgi:hypothetical protein